MRATIIQAIYDKLNAIDGIEEVFKYNKGHFTKYPVAVILGSENTKERESTASIMKNYKFKVQILQEVNEKARGQEAGEEILVNLSDVIDTAFDNDDTLGGVVDDVNIGSVFIYEDRELLMRVLELSIECRQLVQIEGSC